MLIHLRREIKPRRRRGSRIGRRKELDGANGGFSGGGQGRSVGGGGGGGVEDGEVVGDGVAVGAGVVGVGGIDDGGIEAAGALHLQVGGGIGVEVEIQHRGVSLFGRSC